MSNRPRLGLLGAACVAALAAAATALGAYSPQLTVSRHVDLASGSATTDITFSQSEADDPTAKTTILVPARFSSTLNQAPGTQLGTLDGTILALALGGAVTPVTGTLTVGDRTNATLAAAAQQCTASATHDAIWLLNVSAGGTPFPQPFPAYVDVPEAPPTTSFASTSVQLCLPHPSLAPFGAKLLSVTVHLSDVFAPPAAAGAYRWTSANVPWNPTTPTVNPVGTIETQSIDRTPVSVSFAAKRLTKTRRVKHRGRTDIFYSYSARLSGRARRGGEGAAGAAVDIFVGKKMVASTTTGSKGSFSTTLKLAKTTTFQARISKDPAVVAGATCQPALPLGTFVMPCGRITEGGFTTTTKRVTVKKPKLRVKHLRTGRRKG